jgi:Ca2+/H+ antiporter, TMEM165/GDT1 family
MARTSGVRTIGGKDMNLERVVFCFFIVLALALNVVFVIGDIENPEHHSVWVLTIAIFVSLIATGLKLGDRTQVGAVLLATSLVADTLLIVARVIWVVQVDDAGVPEPNDMVAIVSLSAGALAANLISVAVLVSDALMSRH